MGEYIDSDINQNSENCFPYSTPPFRRMTGSSFIKTSNLGISPFHNQMQVYLYGKKEKITTKGEEIIAEKKKSNQGREKAALLLTMPPVP